MKKVLASILISCAVSPAYAWGDREQGIAAGVIGTLLFQHIDRQSRPVHPPVYHAPPVYVPQPQTVIIQNGSVLCPVGLAPFYSQRFDQYGRVFYVFDGCR